jgi:hypothetical protein
MDSDGRLQCILKIKDASFGLQKSAYNRQENSTCHRKIKEEPICYIPVYDVLGWKYSSQTDINFKKLNLTWNISDDESKYCKFKNIDFKVDIIEQAIWETYKRWEFTFHLEGDSVNSLSLYRDINEPNTVNLYITLHDLPNVTLVETTHSDNENSPIFGRNGLIRSPLWKTDLFENWIISQLSLSIQIEWNQNFNAVWDKKLHGINQFMICEGFISSFAESSEWHKMIWEISRYLKEIPYPIHYSFLWLFSTNIINLLDYPLVQYREVFDWIINELKNDESSIESLNSLLESLRSINLAPSISLFSYFKKELKNINSSSDEICEKEMVPIRKVVITPSWMLFKFPTPKIMNRVLRENYWQISNFLLVSLHPTVCLMEKFKIGKQGKTTLIHRLTNRTYQFNNEGRLPNWFKNFHILTSLQFPTDNPNMMVLLRGKVKLWKNYEFLWKFWFREEFIEERCQERAGLYCYSESVYAEHQTWGTNYWWHNSSWFRIFWWMWGDQYTIGKRDCIHVRSVLLMCLPNKDGLLQRNARSLESL